MIKSLMMTAFVAGALVLTAGCASDESLQGQIDQNARKIEALQSSTDDAQNTANEALETAREAQENSEANSERIDRAWHSSQSK